MKSIKKTSLKILLAGFACSTLAFFATTPAFANSSQDVTFTGAEFASEYAIGSELVLPNVEAMKGGSNYATQKSIVFPSGAVKNVSKDVLSEPGKYSVRYSVNIDGFVYEKDYDFIVKQKLFNMDRPSGTATYDETKGAIALHMGGNNPFLYNSVVDLSDNDEYEPFFEMYNVSSQTGERDCEQIIVTLTDVDDEENYINIRINAAPDFKKADYTYDTSYVAVSVNGGEYIGKERETNSVIHKGNAYGTIVPLSFCNMGFRVTPENDRIQLYYNASARQILARGTASSTMGGVVVDFTSEDFYNEFWEGFSVDKCKLSVYAASMKTASVDFFITNVDGQDLSKAYVVDGEGPELNVELPESVPSGIVGCAYNVFDYSVRDDYGVRSNSVSAYYNYYSKTPVPISIENGKIYPKYEGIYTLVYKAVDAYGNKTEKLVNVTVENDSVASPLTISVSENFENCLAGSRVDLKDYTIVSDEKYGGYDVKVSAVCGDYTAEIKEDGYFYANKVGEWKVVYEVIDDLGRKSVVEKTFTASTNSAPVFGEHENVLPKYLLSGASYQVPSIKAYKYSQAGTETVTPSVKYALNGQTTEVSGSKITPVYTSGQQNLLTLTYYVGEVEYSVSSTVVETLKDDNFNAKGLFYLVEGAVTTELENDGIAFTATEKSKLDFVSPLLETRTETELTMPESGKMTLLLADEKDASQLLSVGLTCQNGKITVSLNGVKKLALERNSVRLSVKGNSFEIEGTPFKIREYANGSEFNGFASGSVMLSYVLEEGCSVKVSKVANQPISSYNKDVIEPVSVLNGKFERTYENGQTVVVPTMRAFDVISGEQAVKVSVWANEQYLKTTDGRTLENLLVTGEEMKFTASEFGYYTITYTAVDASGNEMQVEYSINVLDDIKPTLSVNGKISSSAKVGDTISVPSMKVSDNISEELRATVFAIDPTLAYKTVNDGKITFDKAGKWTVRFFVIDEAGNATYVDYVVNVKEA